MSDYDVIVVGAGNAAQAAAMSALENGAKKVAILEKANEEMRGGNTHWSGGILRIAFDFQILIMKSNQSLEQAVNRQPGFRLKDL